MSLFFVTIAGMGMGSRKGDRKGKGKKGLKIAN
jgi:hypothetical protein